MVSENPSVRRRLSPAAGTAATIVSYHCFTKSTRRTGRVQRRVSCDHGDRTVRRNAVEESITTSMKNSPQTLFEKIWDEHVVLDEPGRQTILYIDLHLVHEVTSPQAFESLRLAGRKVRRPERTLSTVDHNVPTTDRSLPILDPISKQQIDTLRNNCREFGITLYDIDDVRAGHRPRHRPRAGLHAAGHDDRLRRQPHLDARRVRRAGLRHRHERSRARAGHANAAAIEAQDAGAARRRPARPGRHGQGRDPVPHRPDHHERRHRLLHRVHGRGHPRRSRWKTG